ncbi:MAG: LamG-like jellyroll fold domain-containing protein [Myxococcota bacterium]
MEPRAIISCLVGGALFAGCFISFDLPPDGAGAGGASASTAANQGGSTSTSSTAEGGATSASGGSGGTGGAPPRLSWEETVLADGPILWWRFDDNDTDGGSGGGATGIIRNQAPGQASGGGTTHDYDGTCDGCVLYGGAGGGGGAGPIGDGYAKFNNNDTLKIFDSQVTGPLRFVNRDEFTIEVWVQLPDDVNAQLAMPIVSRWLRGDQNAGGGSSTPGYSLQFDVSPSTQDVTFGYYATQVPGRAGQDELDKTSYPTGASPISSGFHHVIAVSAARPAPTPGRDPIGNTLTLFYDGRTSVPVNTEILLSDDNAASFGVNLKGASVFLGSVDELVVYDRALAVEEVQSHYCAVRADADPAVCASGASP